MFMLPGYFRAGILNRRRWSVREQTGFTLSLVVVVCDRAIPVEDVSLRRLLAAEEFGSHSYRPIRAARRWRPFAATIWRTVDFGWGLFGIRYYGIKARAGPLVLELRRPLRRWWRCARAHSC